MLFEVNGSMRVQNLLGLESKASLPPGVQPPYPQARPGNIVCLSDENKFSRLLSFLQIQCSFNFLSLSMPTSGGTQQRFAAMVSRAV